MAAYGPQLVVNDLIQTRFISYLADQVGMNVRHYQVLAISTEGDADLGSAITALLATGIPAAYKDLLTTPASYRGVLSRVVQPALSLEYGDITGQGVGTAGVSPVPRQCAGFLRIKSMATGRGKSGRLYIPFPDETHCEPDGRPTTGYMTAANALGALLKATVTWGTGGILVPVIYTRPDPDADPPILASVSGVRDIIGVRAFATQRRRGSFGRTNSDPL